MKETKERRWPEAEDLSTIVGKYLSFEGKKNIKIAPLQRGHKGWDRKLKLVLLFFAVFAVSAFLGFSDFSPVKLLENKGYAISGDLIKDVTIMYASVLATMIGLCVTAFIFLNDTLKNRAENDSTLRNTVNDVFKVYSYKLKQLAVGTAIVIVLIVVLNIFGHLDVEMIPAGDIEFKAFAALTVMSIVFVVLIIAFSCEITYSDRLLRNQAKEDYNDIKKVLGVIVKSIKECQPEGGVTEDDMSFDLIRREYNIGMVYVQCFPDEFGILSGKSRKKKEEDGKKISKGEGNDAAEAKGRYTRFLRDMGYIETVIDKICLNNINDSITASDSRFESMRIGFEWLYSEKKGDAYYIDVRDEHRYLDFIKYCLIAEKRFASRGYDNEAIEKRYEDFVEKFRSLPTAARVTENGEIDESYDSKGGRIIEHKNNLRRLIENFFCVYEILCMYKNALIHIEATSGARRLKDGESSVICPDENAEKLVEVLKELVINRFTSFVKINDVNLGNSNVRKGWFNHTVFNDSNFTCSDFEFARLEHTVMRNCDLSTCKMLNADASDADLVGSNLNYSNLIGVDFNNANLTRTQMSNVVFRDPMLDKTYYKVPVSDADLAEDVRSQIKGSSSISLAEFLVNGAEQRGRITAEEAAEARGIAAGWENQKAKLAELLSKDSWSRIGCNEKAVLNAVRAVKKEIIDNKSDAAVILQKAYNYLWTFHLRRETNVINDKLYRTIYKGSREEPHDCHRFRIRQYGRVHFRTAILRNATVDGVSLNNVDFSHVDMRFVSFRDSDLSSSQMYYTKARGADFTDCNLRGNEIHKTDFADAVFNDANLVHATISSCNMQNASFRGAVMLNCKIVNLEYNKPHLYFQLIKDGRNVESSQLLLEQYGFDLNNYDLCDSEGDSGECERKMAFAVHSDWSDVVAAEAVIISVDMDSSIFEGANFKRAALINNSMRWGSFRNAVLSEALVTCCSFHQSNLRDADFSNARFCDCRFTDCCLQNVNMIGAVFERVDFTNCDLRNANLSNAIFRDCTFDYAILDDVTVIGTKCDTVSPAGATWRNKKGQAESGFFRNAM